MVHKGDTTYSPYEDYNEAKSYGPEYYFEAPDSYTVSLVADNGHISEKKLTFLIDTFTYADFSYTECNASGTSFINKSGCADEFKWFIDDSIKYITFNPYHRFSDTGKHKITLVAKQGGATDSLTREINIRALGFPSGEFTYLQKEDTVFFKAKDIDGISFYWDFGDGTTDDSSGASTYHVYPIPQHDDVGFYTVSLWMNNLCGMDYSFQDIQIKQLTSIKRNKGRESKIDLFPNPAKKTIHIVSSGNDEYHVSIINMKGEVVFEQEYIGECRIDVGNVAPGFYFMKFISNNAVASKKIVISK